MARSPYLTVSSRAPTAAAICDRCQRETNHYKLSKQMDYRGGKLVDTGLLVCRQCLDVPNPQFARRFIEPDPTPIIDPRPQRFIYPDYLLSEDGLFILDETGLPILVEAT